MNTISRWPIWGSIIFTMVLSMINIPYLTYYTYPLWIPLIVIYWLTHPHNSHFGLFSAWLTGVLNDILTHSLLAQHGLSILIMSVIILNLKQRFVRTHFIEKLLFVTFFLLVFQIIYIWINIIILQMSITFISFIPVATSLLIWIPLSYLLNHWTKLYSTGYI